MANAAGMRKLALALPDVEEKSHFEQPDFRVRGKIFAGLSRDEKRGNLKLPLELQATVLDARPEAFSPAAGAWGRGGWTYVDLAHVHLGELETLVREAWRLVAPKKLTLALTPPPAPRAPAGRTSRAPAGSASSKPSSRRPSRRT
jgi:hypothetical protein